MWPRACTLAAAALLAQGCFVFGYADPDFVVPAKRRAEVRDAAEAFAANLRWGRFPAAAARVDPESRIEFLKLVQDPEEPMRFTGFEVMAVELGEEMTQARALVTFTLHRLPSMTEVVFHDDQQWRYEASHARWYLMPQLDAYRNAGKRQLSGR